MWCNFKQMVSKAIFLSDIIELTCCFSKIVNDVCDVLDEVVCCDNREFHHDKKCKF